MKYTKRPRPNRQPPWNAYDIMVRMTPEEVASLLWVPKVIHAHRYGMVVTVDAESDRWLTTGHGYTWLWLMWGIDSQNMELAPCKVHLNGIDDSNYGAWLTARTHQEYVDTWHRLLAFLDECGAREYGVNGEYLLDYCDEHLGAYERDYN